MKRAILILFCLLTTLSSFGQAETDFQNKRLKNSLRKNGISELSALKEMNVGNSGITMEIGGRFFMVTEKVSNSDVKYVYVGRVNSCRAGGCSGSGSSTVNPDSEYFDYYIIFSSDGIVSHVEVFNYQASHGYEISAKGWLKQFIGFSGRDSLEVNKNIDTISGATISVYAITNDVQEKTRLLKTML